jgi:uncharacterized protein (TIGR01777 family)
VKTGPVPRRWVAEHRDVEPGRGFRDVQLEGPFRRWEHAHSMTPDGPDACRLEDRVDYELPLGSLGRVLGGGFVRGKLEAMFGYRHRVTRDDLAAHRRFEEVPRRTVLVTGASGLVGTALTHFLTTGGHTVVPLVRSPGSGDRRRPHWDPAAGTIDTASLEGIDAVVHLAGENIAGGRWTPARKARIRESRVQGTRLLAEALARLTQPPQVLVSASAVGYYGSRGDESVTEESEPGLGFLAEVCRAWEAATAPAAQRGIRVVHARLGVVLSLRGGALAKLLPPFRAGLGGKVGTGRQFMSWVHVDDAVGAVHHALMDGSLAGAVNVTAPDPVTNLEFTRALGRVLVRPTLAPLPATPARLLFGEMADALLLEGVRALPARLEAGGYRFRHPRVEDALRFELGRALA